MAGTAMVWNHP